MPETLRVNGKYSGTAYVDAEDFERLNKYNWCCSNNRTICARINGKTINIGRFLINTDMECVDHIDGNFWNNRKDNLRPASLEQNARNRLVKSGAYYDKKRNKYIANIRTNLGRIFLGRFDTKEEAEKAYRSAQLKYHKEFVRA